VAVENEWIANFSDSVEANALPPTEALLLDSWLKKYHTNYSADDIDLLMITRRTIFQPFADTGLNKEIHDFDDNRVLQNLIGKIVNRKGSGVSGRIVTTIARNSHEFFMDVD